MSQEKDSPVIIPLNEYKPELEAEVMYHAARIEAANPFRIKKKFIRPEIPNFKPTEWREQRDWELSEIQKCIHGTGELSGRAYYFFAHVAIKHKSRGKIRPD